MKFFLYRDIKKVSNSLDEDRSIEATQYYLINSRTLDSTSENVHVDRPLF